MSQLTETTAIPTGEAAATAVEPVQASSAVQETTTETEPVAETTDAEPSPTKPHEFVAPEGVTFDPAVIEAFGKSTTVQGMSAEAAQALLNEMAPVIVERQAKQLEERKAALIEQWTAEAKADKEIGGANYDKNLDYANKAFVKFSTPEFQQLADQLGLLNHPEFIRVFHKIQKAISPDTPLRGKAEPPAKPKTFGQLMYPNMNP